MKKKPADKRFANVLTIKQLTELCETLTGKTLKESLAIGKKSGITRHNVESLRQILGYSEGCNSYKLTAAERDKIAEEYSEGGVSMTEIARRHGVTYNAVRCILVTRQVTLHNHRCYTPRQEAYIRTAIRRKVPLKEMAFALNKSPKAIMGKLERMGLKYEATPRRKHKPKGGQHAVRNEET